MPIKLVTVSVLLLGACNATPKAGFNAEFSHTVDVEADATEVTEIPLDEVSVKIDPKTFKKNTKVTVTRKPAQAASTSNAKALAPAFSVTMTEVESGRELTTEDLLKAYTISQKISLQGYAPEDIFIVITTQEIGAISPLILAQDRFVLVDHGDGTATVSFSSPYPNVTVTVVGTTDDAVDADTSPLNGEEEAEPTALPTPPVDDDDPPPDDQPPDDQPPDDPPPDDPPPDDPPPGDTVSPTSMITTSVLNEDTTVGATTEITGTATDDDAGVDHVVLQLRKGGDTNACLNVSLSAFDQACSAETSAITATGATSWTLTLADAIFEHGASYTLFASAVDAEGNAETPSQQKTFVWGEPVAPETPQATATEAGNHVQWELADESVLGYLIVRRTALPVSFVPVSGQFYYPSQELGDDQTVIQLGYMKSTVDYRVMDGVTYHYAIFGYAEGFVYSKAAESNATYNQIPAFRGPTAAYVTGVNGETYVQWAPAGNCLQEPYASLSFEVFSAALSGQQNFANALATSGPCSTSVAYQDATAIGQIAHLMVQHNGSGGAALQELALDHRSGAVHRLTQTHMLDGASAQSKHWGGITSHQMAGFDRWHNVFFHQEGIPRLYVICVENIFAPYCRGRELDKFYTIAGFDGLGDGPGNQVAMQDPMGDVISYINTDQFGNIYYYDSTNWRLRAVCFYTQSDAGFCAGKQTGYGYIVWGNGGLGNAGDNVDPLTVPASYTKSPVAIDLFGNIYAGSTATGSGMYLRVICYNTSVKGPCFNKPTVGHIYHVVGSTTATDGADNVAPLGNTTGLIFNVDVDIHGNIYYADSSYLRFRALCIENRAPGFCHGKTEGRLYRVWGTGGYHNSTGDDADVERPHGFKVDPLGNLFFTNDAGTARVRVLCFDNREYGYCNGKAVNTSYRFENVAGGLSKQLGLTSNGNIMWIDDNAGRVSIYCVETSQGFCQSKTAHQKYSIMAHSSTSSLYDSPDATLAIETRHGSPEAMTTDPKGNLYFIAGSTDQRARVLCQDPTSVGVCNGKTVGNTYYAFGTGDGNSDFAPALGTSFHLRSVSGMASDKLGNIYFYGTHSSDVRVFVFCNDTSAGFCSGRTQGWVYTVMGPGAELGDDVLPADVNLVTIAADVAVDSFYNIYVATNGPGANYYLRAYCLSDQGTGFCAGKITGRVYHVIGDGTRGDGADGEAVSTAYPMGEIRSFAIDDNDNIYLADGLQRRARVICYDVSAGFCSLAGREVGKIYHAMGTGANGDGADSGTSTDPATVTIGYIEGIALDQQLNIYVSDDTFGRIRVLCVDTSTGFCAGKVVGNLYRLAGTGSVTSGTMTSNLPALEVSFKPFDADGVSIGIHNEIYLKTDSIQMIIP